MLRSPNVWKVSQIHPVHSLFVCYKNDLSWLNNPLWQGFNSLGCPLMLRTNYTCIQSLNISVNVAKCVENFQKFTQNTHFLSVTKKDLSWLNNLFMARFQLIRMSSYAKNKLQMCSVTQHQCKHCQMCGKFSHKYTYFLCYKNDLSWLNNLFTERFHITMSPLCQVQTTDCSVKTTSFFVTDKKWVLGEFVKIFHTFGLLHWCCLDWTHL